MSDELKYHARAFANLGIEPEVDPNALEQIRQIETKIGRPLPESVIELIKHKDADKLLQAVEDKVPSIESFGDDYSTSFPMMEIFHDREGAFVAYIVLDEKDDPDVRCYGDEDSEDFYKQEESGEWKKIEPSRLHTDVQDGRVYAEVGSFSKIVLSQTRQLLDHLEREEQRRREHEEYLRNRTIWEWLNEDRNQALTWLFFGMFGIPVLLLYFVGFVIEVYTLQLGQSTVIVVFTTALVLWARREGVAKWFKKLRSKRE